MIRFSKKYIKKTTRDLSTLAIESALIVKYGLRNKKELNKARGLVQKYQKLSRSEEVGSEIYNSACNKLIRLGVLPSQFTIRNIQTLTVEHFLNRRLQTLVAASQKISLFNARQLITHGQIKVNGVIKRHPCYLIRLDSKITVR